MPAIILGLPFLAALGYAALCAAFYLLQEHILLFPERNAPGTAYDFGLPAQEIRLPVHGASLHALWFRVAESRSLILFFHGNAGSLRTWGESAAELAAQGYDVLIVDYRGYGQSSGRISSEAQLLADAAAVYAWAQARYPEERIVLYGRSLGASLAARLAADNQPRRLIMVCPFFSAETIVRRSAPWLPPALLKYPLRTHTWIGRVRCPVTIIHGTGDDIVPFADGKRLSAAITAPLRFYPVTGAGHNDMRKFAEYHEAIRQALVDATEVKM